MISLQWSAQLRCEVYREVRHSCILCNMIQYCEVCKQSECDLNEKSFFWECRRTEKQKVREIYPSTHVIYPSTHVIYRGYYTVARRYEVYLRVEKLFHEWAQRTSDFFFPREDKLHIVKPTSNFLFITLLM